MAAAMISVAEARTLIGAAIRPVPAETVDLAAAAGRTLAEPVLARMTQPPFDASAMDGYAVRLADCAVGASLSVIGESAAGKRFKGSLAKGEAVRIFTGAPVPPGADHVVIQEEAERAGAVLTVKSEQARANVRRAGIDFGKGDDLAGAGAVLSGPLLALIAAGNVAEVRVRRIPSVAIIANGDELALPGAALGEDDIVSSIPFGLAAMIEGWGGRAEALGVARDDPAEVAEMIVRARGFDVIVPIGGASVGDRDFMRAAFNGEGFEPIFEKVSVKPGKPTFFGRLGQSFVLGLPGNPASALVTARLFLKHALSRLLERKDDGEFFRARLAEPLSANGPREAYLRARLSHADDGARLATPFANQDSSLLSVLAASDILIRREANAPTAPRGALMECLCFPE
jgi:molybdopterin molybdotransferase